MIAAVVLAGAMLLTGQAAVDQATQQAEALGYKPCHAEVVDAASNWGPVNGTHDEMPADVAGWAAWPEVWGVCQIGLTPETVEDPEWLGYVAQHEVCHLAVGLFIDTRPEAYQLEDRHHQHPAFDVCMGYMTGWQTYHDAAKVNADKLGITIESVSPPLPEPPPPPAPNEPTASLPGGGTTGVDVYSKIVAGPTSADYENCLALQEVKPWIDWECSTFLPATQGE